MRVARRDRNDVGRETRQRCWDRSIRRVAGAELTEKVVAQAAHPSIRPDGARVIGACGDGSLVDASAGVGADGATLGSRARAPWARRQDRVTWCFAHEACVRCAMGSDRVEHAPRKAPIDALELLVAPLHGSTTALIPNVEPGGPVMRVRRRLT